MFGKIHHLFVEVYPLLIRPWVRVAAAMADNVDRLVNRAAVWNVRRDAIDIGT